MPVQHITNNKKSRGDTFEKERLVRAPKFRIPKGLTLNKRLKMDGLKFLRKIDESVIPTVFFDPQYRGILNKLKYGNEKSGKSKRRAELEQMSEENISQFLSEIERVLIPSGHLFLWVDKFHLCDGVKPWFFETNMQVVDLLTWQKTRIGMGYRTRRRSEYCVIVQKQPIRAKGVWTVRNIPDVVHEQVSIKQHPHAKPVDIQSRLIEATTAENDIVVDPAAGSFSVLDSALSVGRRFLGCDVNPDFCAESDSLAILKVRRE